MNDLIDELIEQATIRGEEYLPGNDGHPTPTVYFDKRKFAELLIREAARAIDKVYEDAEPDHGCYDWATWAEGSDVLAHFGLDTQTE